MTASIGVVSFPGSNCEHDVVSVLCGLGARAFVLWHGDADLHGADAIVIPGGFAHGDYLRPGAIARFSPVMAAVSELAGMGGPVVGICNGFQVLCEAGLLPGALMRNDGLRFICAPARCTVVTERSVLTGRVAPGSVLTLPINHYEGNFVCDETTLEALEREERVVMRYVENPNGSVHDIAGITNEARNVVGLMPHPERAADALLGSTDGLVLLASLVDAAEEFSLSRVARDAS